MTARMSEVPLGRTIAPSRVTNTHAVSCASEQICATSGIERLATSKRNCTPSIPGSPRKTCTSFVFSSPHIRKLGLHDDFSGSMEPIRSNRSCIVAAEKCGSIALSCACVIRTATAPLIITADDGIRSNANCQIAISKSLFTALVFATSIMTALGRKATLAALLRDETVLLQQLGGCVTILIPTGDSVDAIVRGLSHRKC